MCVKYLSFLLQEKNETNVIKYQPRLYKCCVILHTFLQFVNFSKVETIKTKKKKRKIRKKHLGTARTLVSRGSHCAPARPTSCPLGTSSETPRGSRHLYLLLVEFMKPLSRFFFLLRDVFQGKPPV